MASRKTVRHFYKVSHLHELAFSCYRRMSLLTNDYLPQEQSLVMHAVPDNFLSTIIRLTTTTLHRLIRVTRF
jgi:hypothetical protein